MSLPYSLQNQTAKNLAHAQNIKPRPAKRGGGAGTSKPTNKGTGPHPRPGGWENVNQRLWAVDSGLALFNRIVGKLEDWMPSFVHTISVACQGGPEADLRRIWYLTCAAALGRYRNRVFGVQAVTVEATWNVTGKACSLTIGYKKNGVPDAIVRGLAPVASSGLSFIQEGPTQVTIGSSWAGLVWAAPGGSAPSLGGVAGGGVRTTAPTTPTPVDSSFAEVVGGIAVSLGIFSSSLTLASGTLSTTGTIGGTWSTLYVNCSPGLTAWPVTPLKGSGSAGLAVNPLRELPQNGGAFLPWRRVMPVALGGAQNFGSTRLPTAMIPNLPDDGRVITTGEKRDPRIQNPKPQLDGISRNSLVSLVAQALQFPCLLPKPVPCSTVIPQSLGSQGLQIYAPGAGGATQEINNAAIQKIVDQTPDAIGVASTVVLPAGVGPDGYPLIPDVALNLRQ